MEETLLTIKNAKAVIIAILVVTVVLGSIIVGINKANEKQQVENLSKTQESGDLYSKLDFIFEVYNSGKNEMLNKHFENFLEVKFGEKQTILRYDKVRSNYNNRQYLEYQEKLKELENSLGENKISKEKYENEQNLAKLKYEESKHEFKVYLNQNQKEIFENSEQDLHILHNIAKTMGTE